MKTVALLVLAASLWGCTDASMSQIVSLGDAAHIECFSGGVKFYSGDSTGKIMSEEASDGWYFRERGTNDLVRVSGSCIVRN